MSDWDTTSTRELLKTQKSTIKKLKDAEDLLDFTLGEKKAMFGSGHEGLVEKGLCDGQTCIHHLVDKTMRGCGCKLSMKSKGGEKWEYFKERHRMVCSLNGDNEDVEFGCDGYESDSKQLLDRKKPAYMKRAYARKVIPSE